MNATLTPFLAVFDNTFGSHKTVGESTAMMASSGDSTTVQPEMTSMEKLEKHLAAKVEEMLGGNTKQEEKPKDEEDTSMPMQLESLCMNCHENVSCAFSVQRHSQPRV